MKVLTREEFYTKPKAVETFDEEENEEPEIDWEDENEEDEEMKDED